MPQGTKYPQAEAWGLGVKERVQSLPETDPTRPADLSAANNPRLQSPWTLTQDTVAAVAKQEVKYPQMDGTFLLNLASLALLGYLALLALRFTAKPKIKITLRNFSGKGFVPCGQIVWLVFYIENVGHWYAKPAVTNLRLWINFDNAFDPIQLRWGSQFEKINQNVRPVRNYAKCLTAHGIHVFNREPGEEVKVAARMPHQEDVYRFWIAAHSDQGDCGVHIFDLKARSQSRERS